MKFSVTSFKDLKVCIKELEPFIRDGNHLETGRRFKKFGNLSSCEILSNWLLCAVINFERQSDGLRICTDPQGGDGIIYDGIEKNAWPTECVLVSRRSKASQSTESLILEQVQKKQNKGGAAYASGKTLIVFLNNTSDEWYPNRVARKLPKKIDFDSVWVVGLFNIINGEHIYLVTELNPKCCPAWCIYINRNFDEWQIRQIQ